MKVAAAIRKPYVRALGLVGMAHFMSHFYGMALPPLFPFLHQDLGVSYTLLGVLLSAKKITSGALQLPAGIAVDRVGAKAMLLFGLLTCSLAIGVLGTTDSLIVLAGIIILLGVGDAVIHPTDYSILNSSMPEHFMGRSFSVHTFCGHLGTAVAPAVVLTLTALWDWRVALMASGLVGVAVTLIVGTQWGVLRDDASAKQKDTAKGAADADMSTGAMLRQIFASPPIIYLFLFFCLFSVAGTALREFAVAGLMALQDMPVAAAGGAISGFLFASAFGVLAGGYVADKTRRHDVEACVALFVTAILVAIIGGVDLHFTVLVFCFTIAGFFSGVIRPARDMMIRNAAPRGTTGKVFGFVFSGSSLGGGIAPVVYGFMLDTGKPSWIFYTSAAFMVLCMVVVLLSGRAARRAGEPD
jgi:FSR family fosmidomycin resistance protein-like MFS transporter